MLNDLRLNTVSKLRYSSPTPEMVCVANPWTSPRRARLWWRPCDHEGRECVVESVKSPKGQTGHCRVSRGCGWGAVRSNAGDVRTPDTLVRMNEVQLGLCRTREE
ncbi:hypothetical protein J6590_065821 [Homalodisca vitripennis]|nr:hypothetical protein J6590_065821 [Homalodisca vitripennis]